jgi:xanthine dehydrogenase iron-sulfur cluster and FAD-binding subunit A
MTVAVVASTRITRFTVNGTRVEVAVPGGRRLLDILREDLGLTGTKEGCGEGECGACSVLVDGQVVNSCLVPVCQVDGRDVRTVEGLADGTHLDPLQVAFVAGGAVQCGFCTPGLLAAGRAFLDSGVPATEPAIREAIAGNLCRCTGYTKIIEAIEIAALSPGGEAGSRTRAAPPTTSARPLAPSSGRRTETPRTLDEALRLLGSHPCRIIAGGTDVMVELENSGPDGDDLLLDTWGLDELRGIRVERRPDEGDRAGPPVLGLGALTTYAELRRSALVADHLPVLAEVAATVGAAQIQNRGTLGGNIANASPAGDTLPVLLATDAVIVLVGVDGERRVPVADFFTGYRTTARAPRELILRVEIPLPAGRVVRFRKVGTRRALAISRVVMAVSWREPSEDRGCAGTGRRGSDGPADLSVWRDVRVALGSVAPVPMRARETEAILEGAIPSRAIADRAVAAVAAEITPIDDVRSTAAYRRVVTGRVLRRIIRDAGGW